MILEKFIDDEPDFAVLGMHFFFYCQVVIKKFVILCHKS